MEPGDLNHGEKARNNKGSGDEVLRLLSRQVGTTSTGQDDGRRDDTSQHGQGMLESEQDSQHNGHAVVEAEERWWTIRLLHEGEVWPEKEGIVVVADKALLGEEGTSHSPRKSTQLLAHAAPRCRLGHNLGGDLILVHGAFVDGRKSK